MPPEAEFLLNTVALKVLCRAAGVDRIDAGEKAVVLSLHDNKFAKPDKLIAWLQKNAPLVRLRPDHRVIVAARLERRAPAAFRRDVDRFFFGEARGLSSGFSSGRAVGRSAAASR